MQPIWVSIRVRRSRNVGYFLLGFALLSGCGGKSSQDQPTPGEYLDAGMAGGPYIDAGMAGGRSNPESRVDAGARSAPPHCPGRDEPLPAECPTTLFIDLPFVEDSSIERSDGIVLEALQIPSFTEANHVVSYQPAPPEEWDRSELPAGACVFRLRGLQQIGCYARGGYGDIFVGSCAALQNATGQNALISPGSYYLQSSCPVVVPGCTTANWGGSDGYWWYLNSRENAIDLVICAPQCAGSFTPIGACLVLQQR